MLKSFVGRAGAEFNTNHIDEDAWARLADAMTYISGDLTKPDLYEDVRAALDEAEKAHGTRGNAIFYLAFADRLFGAVVDQLDKAKLTDQGEDQNGGRRFWRRVLIEKPFGHNLDSARALNSQRCTRIRFSGSTTFSARTQFRTSWLFVSPMASSSRCGIATASTMCRLQRRRPHSPTSRQEHENAPSPCVARVRSWQVPSPCAKAICHGRFWPGD